MSDLVIDKPAEASSAVRILLDAPSRRNALTLETVQHLNKQLAQDPGATVLLGSTSSDIFCAGADLDITDHSRAQLSDLLYECYQQIITRPGVVVAVIEGAAVGGGAQLSAAADLRFVTANARWRWVGPGHGLAVGAWILPELFGRARGLDLTLTSRWLDAPEAVQTGFAACVDTDPWSHAYAVINRFAQADLEAIERVKRVATSPQLLTQLAFERSANKSSWTGSAPTASAASADSRRNND